MRFFRCSGFISVFLIYLNGKFLNLIRVWIQISKIFGADPKSFLNVGGKVWAIAPVPYGTYSKYPVSPASDVKE